MAKARYVVIVGQPDGRTKIVANVATRAEAKDIALEYEPQPTMIRKVGKRKKKKKSKKTKKRKKKSRRRK